MTTPESPPDPVFGITVEADGYVTKAAPEGDEPPDDEDDEETGP